MPEVTFGAVLERVATLVPLPAVAPTPDTALRDIVRESFALVEVVVDIQEEWDIFFTQDDMSAVTTLGDLTALVNRSLMDRQGSAP
jgi:acyl carrier protein